MMISLLIFFWFPDYRLFHCIHDGGQLDLYPGGA